MEVYILQNDKIMNLIGNLLRISNTNTQMIDAMSTQLEVQQQTIAQLSQEIKNIRNELAIISMKSR